MAHILVLKTMRLAYIYVTEEAHACCLLCAAYRVVNALFYVVEMVGDPVIGWLPFYYEAKIALLAWMALPAYRGARVLHEKWIAPAFKQHEQVIDTTINDFKRKASEKMMLVAKETAALALQKSSGMVAQSQQYVAAQIVQQAFGRPPTPTAAASSNSSAGAVSSLMSFFGSSSPTAAEPTKMVDASADAKEEPSPRKSHKTSHKAAKMAKDTTDSKDEEQRNAALANNDADLKSAASSKETKSSKRSAPPAAALSTRQEKSKELVQHFKKLLVKGFKLQYHPSPGVVKCRMLRLLGPNSRFVVFEAVSESTSKKKSVKLLLLNIRRVSSSIVDENESDLAVRQDLELSHTFLLDNGKASLIFEAEAQKTRDLLVAGLRLLVTEQKRQDSAALNTFGSLYEKQLLQQALGRMRAMIQS